MFFGQNNCCCGKVFSLICIIFGCLQITLCKFCGDVQLYGPAGTIHSPLYPDNFSDNISCTWRIFPPKKSVVTISVKDLDIEPDEPEMCGYNLRSKMQCCIHNWLALPSPTSGKIYRWCGHNLVIKPINITKNIVTIKFRLSKMVSGGRGFLLNYEIVSEQYDPCKQTEFQCSDGQCVPIQMRCDGLSQCRDQSDEHDCEDPCLSNGKMSCFDGGCFDNKTQLCDGKRDCLNGRDEVLCPIADFCEHKCRNEVGCFKSSQICDGKPDCFDFTDELDCGYCPADHAFCNSEKQSCFKPSIERCDGKFDCDHGEDEVGCAQYLCESSIACLSGEGCYTPSQRCNSQSDCVDESDEAHCPPHLCATQQDKRQCRNGRCLQTRLWCDGSDDCGDGSDEDGCLKTSVVTAAIMGSLLCGLLLVIAVGCTFRIYGQRLTAAPSNYRLHLSPHLASRLRMSHSVSLPALIDDDYFHREPPPAYSVAVGECLPASDSTSSNMLLNSQTPPQLFSAQSSSSVLDYCAQIEHARRHGRFLPNIRRQRVLRTRPQPEVFSNQHDSIKTQNVETSDSQCEASSSQSSPSRESVTSSSYLSGSDDNTLLLSS